MGEVKNIEFKMFPFGWVERKKKLLIALDKNQCEASSTKRFQVLELPGKVKPGAKTPKKAMLSKSW